MVVIQLSCRDECGNKLVAEDEKTLQEKINTSGWEYLQASRAYRCVACWRALREASNIVGAQGETKDTLPPGSIGAIKKPTAHTITPPSLKG